MRKLFFPCTEKWLFGGEKLRWRSNELQIDKTQRFWIALVKPDRLTLGWGLIVSKEQDLARKHQNVDFFLCPPLHEIWPIWLGLARAWDTIGTQTPGKVSGHIVSCMYSVLERSGLVSWCLGAIWCQYMEISKTWFCSCLHPDTSMSTPSDLPNAL